MSKEKLDLHIEKFKIAYYDLNVNKKSKKVVRERLRDMMLSLRDISVIMDADDFDQLTQESIESYVPEYSGYAEALDGLDLSSDRFINKFDDLRSNIGYLHSVVYMIFVVCVHGKINSDFVGFHAYRDLY